MSSRGLAPANGLAAFVIASVALLETSSWIFYIRFGSFVAVAVASFITNLIAVPISAAGGNCQNNDCRAH